MSGAVLVTGGPGISTAT